MGKAKVKVGVRIRPFNSREITLNTSSILKVENNSQVYIQNLINNTSKVFTFDHVFDKSASQEDVYESEIIKNELIQSGFDGYNVCLFSYGQTGSGKTYTMLGTTPLQAAAAQQSQSVDQQRGIIPRLCSEIFQKINEITSSQTTVKVEVSYMEIYNEKVRDLLQLKNSNKTLRVREHTIYGPYVDGLSLLAVKSADDIANLMEEGNKSRTVAATNMNSESSRSHAVFTIVLTITQELEGMTGEKVSRLSLVDLAGSERATKTGAVGERLKEGSNINKSLTTLGLVISKLAESTVVNIDKFIPYRDSILTWLLKDSLGGNSRTIMLATVSPSSDNYEETLSTLRYADRAKRIINNAVVNEDPNAKLIRELQAEVKELRELLKSQINNNSASVSGAAVVANEGILTDQLKQSEKLMRQVSETWEEKLERTEIMKNENKLALEKMGICVQQSGISVQNDRFYLVNLNADPSLNELLVYYLKIPTTLVGSNADSDIQLTGLGIESNHCELIIEQQSCYLIPYPNAKTFINGELIENSKKILKHGDRILWGNHHFFRLNSPYSSSTEDNNNYYEQATTEFTLKQLQNSNLHDTVTKLEQKYRKDKEVALEKQRYDLERQFNALIHVLSPTTPTNAAVSAVAAGFGQQQQVDKSGGKNSKITAGLKHLKQHLLVGNNLVREANEIVHEIGLGFIKYYVCLLIPPINLTPNRVKGVLVTEPSIRVESTNSLNNHPQIWSIEKLQNRLVDMRDIYTEFKTNPTTLNPNTIFYDPDQPHILLGIANVFLQVLFYDDVELKYAVPVINQHGEIIGRLHIEICKISGDKLNVEDRNGDYEEYEDEREDRSCTVKVTIRHLAGIQSAHFVFCQYVFCDNHIVVPSKTTTSVVRFDDTQYFTIPITEEFIEYAEESALSIEVWGHRGISTIDGIISNTISGTETNNNSNITDRWKEVTSQIKLWIEIQELNENGEYEPVETGTSSDQIGTGGLHILKQGLQRRILITLETNANVGQLPIVCDEIDQVSLGAITPRSLTLQRPLDSYQEVDLGDVREKWGEALRRRRNYLDSLLQELASKEEKTEEEEAREKSLVQQWCTLTDERDAVLVPTPDSGVPGAPSHINFKPELGMEQHMPVIFLNISDEILSSSSTNTPHSSPQKQQQHQQSIIQTSGLNSLLPKEHDAVFIPLPMIRKSYGDFYSVLNDQRMSTESWALVSWDSSVHDHSALNKPTATGEVVYCIVRIAVRLSHPVQMDCILRKRICLSIKRNRPSLTERLKSKLTFTTNFGRKKSSDEHNDVDVNQRRAKTGVTYQIVSHLPKSSEQLETRESLANLAVSCGNENYIEEYLRSISAVDSILNLDRMRQSVYLREQQLKTQNNRPATKANNINMRKTLSVPNISQLFVPLKLIPNIMSNSFISSGEEQQIKRRPLRSESLANLSGYTKQQEQNCVSRPSSLNIGTSSQHQQQCLSTGPGKWTSLMTTVEEEDAAQQQRLEDDEEEAVRVTTTTTVTG